VTTRRGSAGEGVRPLRRLPRHVSTSRNTRNHRSTSTFLEPRLHLRRPEPDRPIDLEPGSSPRSHAVRALFGQLMKAGRGAPVVEEAVEDGFLLPVSSFDGPGGADILERFDHSLGAGRGSEVPEQVVAALPKRRPPSAPDSPSLAANNRSPNSRRTGPGADSSHSLATANSRRRPLTAALRETNFVHPPASAPRWKRLADRGVDQRRRPGPVAAAEIRDHRVRECVRKAYEYGRRSAYC
jgi:hypothetical protein